MARLPTRASPSPSSSSTSPAAAAAAVLLLALLPAPCLCSTNKPPSPAQHEESVKYDKLRSRLDALEKTLSFRLMDFSEQDSGDILDSLETLVELFTDDCAEQSLQPRPHNADFIPAVVEGLKTALKKSGMTQTRAARTADVTALSLRLALRFSGVCSNTFKAVYRALTS